MICLNKTKEKIEEISHIIPGEKAIYFNVPIKGGGSLIVSQEDSTYLYVNFSIGFDKDLLEFKNGRRS